MEISLVDYNISITNDFKNKNRRGTIGYMSPEMLYTQDYSFPTNVYSLGVFLHVLFSEMAPITLDQYYFWMPYRIKKIIALCTRSEPNERPTFDDIFIMLTKENKWWCLFSSQDNDSS
jgi:serine/threonine protein kinase